MCRIATEPGERGRPPRSRDQGGTDVDQARLPAKLGPFPARWPEDFDLGGQS